MFKKSLYIIVTCAGATLLGCSSLSNKQAALPVNDNLAKSSQVIARINSQPITEAAIKNLQVETAMYNRRIQVPKEKLLEELIDRELLFQEAKSQGFDKVPAVADQINVAERAIVSKAYMRTILDNTQVSREEIQQEYQQRKNSTDLRQFQISHILLRDEENAKRYIKQLQQGASFQTLAKKFSKDSSAKNGGMLGWRGAKQMTKEVAAAVKQLKPGEFTKQPIKTSYGWQIVLLNNVREQKAPSLAQLEHSLKSIIKRKKLKKYLGDLKHNNTIDIIKTAEKVSKQSMDQVAKTTMGK